MILFFVHLRWAQWTPKFQVGGNLLEELHLPRQPLPLPYDPSPSDGAPRQEYSAREGVQAVQGQQHHSWKEGLAFSPRSLSPLQANSACFSVVGGRRSDVRSRM